MNPDSERPVTREALKKRTKQFGLRVMNLVDALPKTTSGRAIGAQLIRSGTSVGANYRSACRGRSDAEFAAKLGVVVEEADESGYWMELSIEGGLLPATQVPPLLKEAEELVALFTAAIRTTRQRALRQGASRSPRVNQKLGIRNQE